jgi:hypothetical protein
VVYAGRVFANVCVALSALAYRTGTLITALNGVITC